TPHPTSGHPPIGWGEGRGEGTVHGEPPFVLRMHWDHEPPLTRPSATLSSSDGEREGVRGRFMESLAPPYRHPCPTGLAFESEVGQKVLWKREFGADQTDGGSGGGSACARPVDEACRAELSRPRPGKGDHRRFLQVRPLGENRRGLEPVLSIRRKHSTDGSVRDGGVV